MSFGLNQVQIIGRVGADADIRTLNGGGSVANFSVATDESFLDKNAGRRIDAVEWHRVTSFQPGLVKMLEKHCRKGRQVFVQGKLRTRKWQDRDGRDRYTTEILVVPGGRVLFLEKANGGDSGSVSDVPAAAAAVPATAGAAGDPDGDLPF